MQPIDAGRLPLRAPAGLSTVPDSAGGGDFAPFLPYMDSYARRPCAGLRIWPKERGLHRHLHLATSASLAAFIGIIGVGGRCYCNRRSGGLFAECRSFRSRHIRARAGPRYSTIGRKSQPGSGRPPRPLPRPPPSPPPDEPAEQTANVTERTALPTPAADRTSGCPEITLRSFARSAEPATHRLRA